MNETAVIKYPMPPFLNGICTESTYSRWLDVKSNALFQRDEKRKKPYVQGISPIQYRQLIHKAVIAAGLYDPYTGEALRWDLIGTWDSDSAHTGRGKYTRQFALMPTVDHIDPESDTLSFEICSWQINECKGDFAPEDFIAFCAKVSSYCTKARAELREPLINEIAVIKYPMPPFLNGICTGSTYSSWLDDKSESLFARDKMRMKPYVRGISQVQYSQLIHKAVIATGLYDPYTGEALRWDLIGTWDPDSAHAGRGKYKRQFALMPTVDHTDPESDILSLEICSWQVNGCKGDFAPDDFIAFCAKVSSFCIKARLS